MKKLLIFLSATFLFVSCNNNGGIGMGGGGWSNAEKSDFMKQCSQSAATGLGEEKAKQYCACTLEKIQKKYATYNEANAAPNEDITAIGRTCANGMNGGNNGENNGGNFNMNDNGNNNNENFGNNEENGNNNGGFNNDNNNRGANWSRSDKNTFLSQCKPGLANAGYNSDQANQLCNCVLGKLQKKYSSLSDADARGGATAGTNARQECEGGGNDNQEY